MYWASRSRARRLAAATAQLLRAMQEFAHFGARGGSRCPRDSNAWSHHQIDACQSRAFGAEHFARQPLAVIARCCLRNDVLADYDAEPGHRRAIGSCIDLEPLAGYPAFICEYRRIGVRPVEPARPRKREPAREKRQTPRRERPLARRARSTARPARVLMRTRKPCERLRRVPEG